MHQQDCWGQYDATEQMTERFLNSLQAAKWRLVLCDGLGIASSQGELVDLVEGYRQSLASKL